MDQKNSRTMFLCFKMTNLRQGQFLTLFGIDTIKDMQYSCENLAHSGSKTFKWSIEVI